MKHIKNFLKAIKSVLRQIYCMIFGYMIGFGIAEVATATTTFRTAIGLALIIVGFSSIIGFEIYNYRQFRKKLNEILNKETNPRLD